MTTPEEPELIADIRCVIAASQGFHSAWEIDAYEGPECDGELLHDRIKAALAALPSDAVIVPRSLLVEAAIYIEADAGRSPMIAHILRETAGKLRQAATKGAQT